MHIYREKKTEKRRKENRAMRRRRVKETRPLDQSRYFPNPFVRMPSFTAWHKVDWIGVGARVLDFVRDTYPPSSFRRSKHTYCLYTGCAGVAYAFWRLYRALAVHSLHSLHSPRNRVRSEWLEHAFEY